MYLEQYCRVGFSLSLACSFVSDNKRGLFLYNSSGCAWRLYTGGLLVSAGPCVHDRFVRRFDSLALVHGSTRGVMEQ